MDNISNENGECNSHVFMHFQFCAKYFVFQHQTHLSVRSMLLPLSQDSSLSFLLYPENDKSVAVCPSWSQQHSLREHFSTSKSRKASESWIAWLRSRLQFLYKRCIWWFNKYCFQPPMSMMQRLTLSLSCVYTRGLPALVLLFPLLTSGKLPRGSSTPQGKLNFPGEAQIPAIPKTAELPHLQKITLSCCSNNTARDERTCRRREL